MKNITYIFALAILIYGCKPNIETSDAYGNFEAETVIVSAESPGKILQLNIEKGQTIETNFMAALIDTTQTYFKVMQIDAQKAAVESKRQSIRSQIEVLQAQKKILEVNESRTKSMLSDGASTQKQLDDIQGQIRVIDKQIESTKTQFVAVTKEQEVLDAQKLSTLDLLNRCVVKSPVSGTILETYAEQGELTAAGKPLFKIADLSELELKIYVSGALLPTIKLEQKVDVFIDKNESENQLLQGKVSWISSEAEFTPKIIQTKEERVKLVYAVKVVVKNDGTLKIGMPGRLIFKAPPNLPNEATLYTQI